MLIIAEEEERSGAETEGSFDWIPLFSLIKRSKTRLSVNKNIY